MLFNSFHFLVFFVIVTSLYFAIPYKNRWFLLLVSSCYFYMAFVPIYILILGFTIVIDYYAGILIEEAKQNHKKRFLFFSLIANIGVLAVFKYYNFLNENLSFLLQGFALQDPLPHLNILLPIGLSFHTFQAMSYTIEVYRGNQNAERHFGIYSLYVMFYPQLVAGPIERPQNLLHQFREKFDFDYSRVISGLRLMAFGLIKKTLIADRLAVIVDYVYNNPSEHKGSSLILATIFFSFQIFCDFSGYSDMAIGAARIMGFKLMTNFDKPYHSKSVQEFWQRWHISLSTWFKDYLYISLGGNRVTIPRWYLNLIIVFLVSGLWHGANWTFIIWGGLHGFYLVFSYVTRQYRNKFNKFLRINKFPIISVIITFSIISFAWVFFRSKNLETAIYISKTIILTIPSFIKEILLGHIPFTDLGVNNSEIYISILLIIILEVYHFLSTRYNISYLFSKMPIYMRWPIYFILLISILVFGVFENRQFIYFQF